jgi:hypothetical protein
MVAYVEVITMPILNNNHVQWKFSKRQNKVDNHFFVRYRKVTCRYYPNRYGTGQIWLTFSIPKLLSGNNLYPITGNNIDSSFYTHVNDILSEIFDINTLPFYNLSVWQVSRLDLFMLHRIEPKLRKWYLDAYENLSLGAYTPYKYKNTYYLNSTLKKHKGAGTVVRIYPKLQEIYETSSEHIPIDVEEDYEYYMMLNDELHDYIRLEFQFRRQTLRYFFNNIKSVTVADVMQEQFQVERINKMIVRLGLHRKIISRQNMNKQLDKLFVKKPTRYRAGRYITLVNTRGTYSNTIKQYFTEGQIKYIREKLHDCGLHTVVSEFEDLEPIKLL